MILPDKPARTDDDDDFDLELPLGSDDDDDDEESALREDESFLPEDDADLGLDIDDKPVGLDVDTGLDETAESELGEDDEDDASWLDEEAIDTELTADDGEDGDDEEELGEDSEPAKDNGEDWEEDLPDEGATAVSDSGEEGFGEEAATGESEIDLEQLPPLDGESANEVDEPETDVLGTELFDEVPLAASTDAGANGGPAPVEIAPGLYCTRLPAERVKLETLLRIERPLSHLLAAGDDGVGWYGSLLVSSALATAPERRDAGEGRPLALAALSSGSSLWLALAMPRGLVCSSDGGRSFAATNLPPVPPDASAAPWLAASVAWCAGTHGPRLFAAGPDAALWSSDDRGASWTECRGVDRVLRLHGSGRTLVALCRTDDGGAIAQLSRDAGETFTSISLPVREVERVQQADAAGDVLLCSRRAPAPQLVWRALTEDAWHDLSPFASAPAALLANGNHASAYFFVQTQERALLLRRALGRPGLPEIVCEFEHEAGTPLQLAPSQHDGAITLHVGTERGWYRVHIRSGEDA